MFECLSLSLCLKLIYMRLIEEVLEHLGAIHFDTKGNMNHLFKVN